MTKLFRIIAIVVLTVAVFGGSVAAYDGAKKEIVVVDEDTQTTYITRARNVEGFLAEAGIEINEGDEVSKSMLYYLNHGDEIAIDRAVEVVVKINDVPTKVYTLSKTVKDLIKEMKSELGRTYKIVGSEEADEIVDAMVISVYVPKEVTTSKETEIAFETEIIKDSTLAYGTKTVVQQGVAGKIVNTYKESYLADELISSEEISSEVVSEPVKEIVKQGTAITGNSTNGNLDISTLAYSKVLSVQATGYTPYDAGCNGITATGTKAQRGVIAVDPKVIPMGTKVYIPGYGIATAEDTGGAIKGNKIDLCYLSKNEAFAWGRRTVDIYILD